MNKKKDIESYLRENKPQVKDDPTFMLEVRQKMRMVEGIKTEVDRQRRYGRAALVITLYVGLIVGALMMLLCYLYPVDTEILSSDILNSCRMFIDPIKQYLMIPIAGCAISLGIILGTKMQGSPGL